MRRAVRAIILHDDNLAVMYRNKFGEEYITLPGGNVEAGETLEQALAREIDEELSMKVVNPRLVFIEHAGDMYGDQYIFLCEYQGGKPALRPGSEEDLINKMQQNIHKPGWLPLDKINELPFRSEELKQRILTAINEGWPAAPVEF